MRRSSGELEEMWLRRPAGMMRREVEARNLHTVATAIVRAALGREESRGAHARRDFPRTDEVARHSILRGGELRFEE